MRESNDHFREHGTCLRQGTRRESSGEFTTRSAGIERPLRAGGGNPYASINFVIAHDGFTLHDLVSYDEKHNEANGEKNRNGQNPQPELELRGRGSGGRSED